MCVTSESDETIMSNDGMNSPPKDDANSTGTAEGNGQLKKGPWTSAEDAILVEYVTKHGEGNWNAVQRHTGLARCGKSCRLRWANHLRPDLKKGAFTPEEEQLIVELHAKMGNKWARMAAEMPGRTDNEIKNYWNTRMKRRQRAGLSIYPSDISFQASNDNQPKDNVSAFSSGDAHSQDAMPVNSFEIPAIQFKKLELNHLVYSPTFIDIPGGALHDIPGSAFVLHDLQSPYPNKSMLPMMHPPKRLRGPESLYAGSSATMNKTFPDGSQYEIGSFVQNVQPFTYPSAFDPSSSTVLDGSHAVVNGNPSSSESIWAMKQELPSLQTQAGNWGSPSSPLPPLEPLQTPPTEHNLSCQLSSQNSGLLDAVLHESQVMNHPRNSSDLLTPHASNMGFALMDGSTDSTQFINQTGWEPFDELTSPLRHSSSSMFSESNVEPETITGFRAKEDAAIWVPTQYNEGELTNQMFSQPELLLPPDCFDPEGKRNT